MAAELKGKITLNDSLFTAGLRRAKNEGTRFAKQFGSNLKGFLTQPIAQIGTALLAAISYRAFQAGIQGSLGLGDELYRLNLRTGITVGSLAQLKKLSQSTGVEFEGMALGVNRMQRQLIEAAKTGHGPAASAFRLLKLETSELLKLRPEQQFQKVGMAINALPDPALRTAVAMKLFGRAGAEMLPVFAEIGKTDFGHLDAKSKELQENATTFHEITVAFRKIGSNMQSFFIGFASGFAPILQMLGNLSGTNPFLQWGKALGNFATAFVEFEAGLWGFLKDFIVALGEAFKKAFGKIGGALGALLAPLKDFFVTLGEEIGKAFADAINKIVHRGKSALGIGDDATSADPVNVEGYISPLDNGQHLGSGSLGTRLDAEQWRAQFRPKGHQVNFGGPLGRGAFGQAGGLGSAAKWDPKAIAGMSIADQMRMLMSPEEMQQAQNQMVAAGGIREASNPMAYGAVAAGDDQRRAAYLKEQLKAKIGVDKSNELLEDIKSNTEAMADEFTG